MKEPHTGPGWPLYFWLKYQRYAENAMQPSAPNREAELEYISNRLFTKSVLYGLPIAAFATIVSVFLNFNTGNIFLPCFGVAMLFSVGFICLNVRIPINYRKVAVSGILILTGIVLIALKGNLGIGSIFILTCSIFYALHFSDKFASRGVWLNVLICTGFIAAFALKLLPAETLVTTSIGKWITYSINFLFLNILIVIMIRQTISRLERALKSEVKLYQELKEELESNQQLNLSLKESEFLYRTLFSLSPSAKLIFDKETLRFLAVNNAATRIYTFSNEEFLSMNLTGIYPSATAEELFIQLKYTHDFEGLPVPVKTEHMKKDGSLINVEFLAADIDFDGQPAKMIVVSDITKQISQVKAIKRQNEKLKEIAYLQSHVIRLPLTKIMALTDLIEHDYKEVVDEELLTSLTKSSDELDQMIRKIVSDSESILIDFNSLSD